MRIVQENDREILHYIMTFVGGFLGLYAICAHGNYGSAQTGNLMNMVIDFVGDGSGTGLSGSAPFRATGCTFTGWNTGVYAYGTSWVNVIGCTFQSNGIGFHFDSTGEYANHSMYNDNRFFGNDVAVRLDNVPTDVALNFQGSVFRNNAQGILNNCDQPLDLSQATFE